MLLLAVSIIPTILGLPSGAPTQACDNGLMPNHNSPANSATGDVPFSVNTDDIGSSYTPGQVYSSEYTLKML